MLKIFRAAIFDLDTTSEVDLSSKCDTITCNLCILSVYENKKRREGKILTYHASYLPYDIIHERSAHHKIYQFPSFCFKIHHVLDSMSILMEFYHIVCDEEIDWKWEKNLPSPFSLGTGSSVDEHEVIKTPTWCKNDTTILSTSTNLYMNNDVKMCVMKAKIEQKQKESYRQARPDAKRYKLWLHFSSFIESSTNLCVKMFEDILIKKKRRHTIQTISPISIKILQAKELLSLSIFFLKWVKFQKFKFFWKFSRFSLAVERWTWSVCAHTENRKVYCTYFQHNSNWRGDRHEYPFHKKRKRFEWLLQ